MKASQFLHYHPMIRNFHHCQKTIQLLAITIMLLPGAMVALEQSTRVAPAACAGIAGIITNVMHNINISEIIFFETFFICVIWNQDK